MLSCGAFTVLFLLSGVSSLLVPAPTNVTVSCQNVKTTVSWIYNKQQPDTMFKVTILPEHSQPHVGYTTEHLYELGDFVWQSQKLYMSFLYVTITALRGDNQSEAVKSNTFSFNDLKTVHTKCFLDFPPVKLVVHGMKMSVTFENPLSFYKELNSTVEETSAKFTFDVILDEHKFNGKCSVKDSFCKLDVMFSEGEEKCVTLTGHLLYNNGINFVSFRKTDRFCSTEPPVRPEPDHGVVYVAVLLMSSFALLICVMIILICKVKAWTTKTPDLPRLLIVQTNPTKVQVHYTDMAVMSPVSMYKPYKTTLIQTEVKRYPESYHMSSSGSNSIPSDRDLYTEKGRQLEDGNQELESLGLISGENGTDNDSANECISVSSQDEERGSISPYDSPHFVMLDMGDGDMVTGYSEKKRVF